MPIMVFVPYAVKSLPGLLMHMDTTNLSAFDTALGNPQNATFTQVGTPKLGEAKFGSTSLLLGNSGYIRTHYRPFEQVGTGDFTFEFQFRMNSLGGVGDHDYCAFDMYPIQMGMDGSMRLYFAHYGIGWDTLVSTAGQLNTDGNWTHIAVTRQKGVSRMFFNGNLVGTSIQLNGVNLNQTQDFAIGARALQEGGVHTTTGNYNIDELRIVIGKALYTANFVPPIAAYTD